MSQQDEKSLINQLSASQLADRCTAIEALGNMKAIKSVPLLIEMMSEQYFLSDCEGEYLMNALQKMHDATFSVLKKMLKQKDTAMQAVRTLSVMVQMNKKLPVDTIEVLHQCNTKNGGYCAKYSNDFASHVEHIFEENTIQHYEVSEIIFLLELEHPKMQYYILHQVLDEKTDGALAVVKQLKTPVIVSILRHEHDVYEDTCAVPI